MYNYSKVLLDNIEKEKNQTAYIYTKNDKEILQELLYEINQLLGTKFRYLAELDALDITNSGEIIAQYIMNFETESVKAYLAPQLVSDKIQNCDKIILQLYLHFKESVDYISEPGVPAPSHIYVRYDNAFERLKSKRIKSDLLSLANNPRDVFYLPFTMRMLASWKVPELAEILIRYLDENQITLQSLGLREGIDGYYPPLEFIKRELKFTAIDALKYYPSDETIVWIEKYVLDKDSDIKSLAKKTMKVLKKYKL